MLGEKVPEEGGSIACMKTMEKGHHGGHGAHGAGTGCVEALGVNHGSFFFGFNSSLARSQSCQVRVPLELQFSVCSLFLSVLREFLPSPVAGCYFGD